MVGGLLYARSPGPYKPGRGCRDATAAPRAAASAFAAAAVAPAAVVGVAGGAHAPGGGVDRELELASDA